MQKFLFILVSFFLMIYFAGTVSGQAISPEKERKHLYNDGKYNPFEVLDTRVDNMRYWKKAAQLGLTDFEPHRNVPEGIFKSVKINARSVLLEDSPDVPVTSVNSTQSENSVFVDPNNPDHVLQSNNSTQNPVGSLYGANYFYSFDFGTTWGGSVQGAGGSNSGDPATAIGLSGRQYVGFIHDNGGQGISYSDNGTVWTSVVVDGGSGSSLLDKNHMWIDNSPSSPYEGNVYSAWTDFGGPNDTEIEIAYSANNGLSYSAATNISSSINAGSHNQGVNIQTGPNGEVYVVWAVYDSWPSDESALGFTKSTNGGASFASANRILSNIRGIRISETSKNHRVNSFPSMAVDISGGTNHGNIYIVWSNIGVPGINTGNDIDVYLIRSVNGGSSWSTPIRVNQDQAGLGHEHYFPWITCDPETGTLSVVFYDDRNVGGNKCEVFCANSYDAGNTWEDFRVSDVDFTPAPIPGLAGGYMGDYLGISARGGKVYPVWTDNRSGVTMSYTSPYETNSLPRPENLTGNIIFETGQTDLAWDFEPVAGFLFFSVYRNDIEIGTTTNPAFTDLLPDYGAYKYEVTAMHNDGESGSASLNLQWGDPHIEVTPQSVVENVQPGGMSTRQVTVKNTGQLPLEFSVSSSTEPIVKSRAYCIPATDCSFGDGFTGFALADISNLSSGCSPGGYGDFTGMSTELQAGNTYQATFQTGYGNQNVCLWIDFNKNQVFDNEELLLEDFNLANSGQNYYANIMIPEGVEGGLTRMRIKANWINSSNDPCENTNYGETEDYAVNISGWLFVDHISGNLNPGESQVVDVLLDASDLTEGTYHGNIKFENNDPEVSELDVPVTLNVATVIPLAVEVTATPENIIQGESAQLNATASGGSGNYTYAWTSEPEGFTSDLAGPVVSPPETTTYFVEVFDGEQTAAGQATVTVETILAEQIINFTEGWNIFSSRVIPENPDMLDVVQPLIDQEILYKVIDENGGSIFYLPFPAPGQWNNSIGDIAATEGYYLKVNDSSLLTLNGSPTALPLEISLSAGWNMISYPCEEPQNALGVVQQLIDADVLYKVIDQNGGVILHLPFPPPEGQWSNTIGNFQPGQGYYVKVTQDISITINNPAVASGAGSKRPVRHDPVFFNKVWQNHPYQPMAVIVKADGWMEPGDEIAVFDGTACVGVEIFSGNQNEFLIIPVGMDDPETGLIDGAVQGNEFTFKIWNRNGQSLYENIPFDYLQGVFNFTALETSVVALDPVLTQLAEMNKPISLKLQPNPMKTDAVLKLSLPKPAFITINLFNGMGNFSTNLMTDRLVGIMEEVNLNKTELNLQPGVYTLQVVLSERPGINPVVKVLKFVVY